LWRHLSRFWANGFGYLLLQDEGTAGKGAL